MTTTDPREQVETFSDKDLVETRAQVGPTRGAVGPTGATGIPGPDARTVFQRMLAIIEELPTIGKTQRNQQQGFMFRGHDDVMNALNPLLAKHGVFVVPDVIERIPGERTTQRGSTMYEVNLHVRFTFFGLQGDSFQASGWGEGTDSGDKATNKAMTMAFKYVIAQVFALATGETSDSDADRGSAEETTRGGARERRQERRSDAGEFDPGKTLRPNALAVKTADDAVALRQAQASLDPAQNWPTIEDNLCQHVFGKGLDELSRAETAQWWRRMANAVAKLPDSFPPPGPDEIRAAYAWAFNGAVVELAEPVPTEPAPDEDDPNQDAVEQAAEEEE